MRTSLRRIVGITTSIAGLTGIALTAGAAPAAAHHQPDHEHGHEHGQEGQGDVELTICHATHSNANPYQAIVVDTSAIDGEGNGDHYPEHAGPIWDATLKAQHIAWGDIIPPLEGVHDGQNWAEGEAWVTNPDGACTAPAGTELPDTADITLDKVLTGAAAPAETTEFSFTVLCEGDEAAHTVVITPADDAEVVAEDVAVGDACEITETAGSPSWTVRGAGAPAGASVDVTVVEGDETVAVVATNDFPATVVQDVCPEAGVQPPGTTCVVTEVAGETLTQGGATNVATLGPAVAEAAAAPAAVAGAELPRTGSSNGQLTAFALGLLLVGIGVSMLGADLRRGLARVA